MRHWTLRFRFGVYAGTLTAVISMLSLMAVRPMIYRHQLAELDSQLEADAADVFGEITKHGGTQINFRKPIPIKYIPASLRLRYLQLNGPEGQVLYRSANLRGLDLAATQRGRVTLLLAEQEARIGTFGHGYLTVHIGTLLGRLDAIQEDLLNAMIWVVPAAGLAAFGVGWLLGGRALQPVIDLTEAAEKIEATQTAEPLRLPQPTARDEIFRLSEVLNHSFERLQNAYAAAERFSADASHQLKTPLAVLKLGLESLRISPDTSPAQRAALTDLERQTRRLTTLVDDLLVLAQADAGRLLLETQKVNLQEHLNDMLEDLEISCEANGITLQSPTAQDLWVVGDPRRIAVILQNLGENAAKYTPAAGLLVVTTRLSATQATVTIANSGPPISKEVRDRIFHRFHRGEVTETNSGHGLGLNIARSLARAQGGDVVLLDQQNDTLGETQEGMVTFVFSMPLS